LLPSFLRPCPGRRHASACQAQRRERQRPPQAQGSAAGHASSVRIVVAIGHRCLLWLIAPAWARTVGWPVQRAFMTTPRRVRGAKAAARAA
jgi:hypothetical protein